MRWNNQPNETRAMSLITNKQNYQGQSMLDGIELINVAFHANENTFYD